MARVTGGGAATAGQGRRRGSERRRSGAAGGGRGRRPGGRTFARLAAIQALYQIEQVKARPEAVIAEFERHRFRPAGPSTAEPEEGAGRGSQPEAEEELEESLALDADRVWFRDLVTGTCQRLAQIDELLNAALEGRREIVRMEITLRAILRTGSYELLARIDTSTAVVIAEYVALAHDFFGKTEADLVNAVLDRIGREVRHGV